MKDLLKELCLTDGISGDENAVRDLIISKIKLVCDYSVDNLGNLICFKKGRKKPKKKLMICAHMDEVGLMVTFIRPDGTLAFDTVGGIDPSVIIGRQVHIGKNRISGVVGSTAVHNLSKEDRDKAPEVDSLYIDIGAESKEEAEKYVSLGDNVCFDSEFIELGGSRVKSKALDDRTGCTMMIKLLHEKLELHSYLLCILHSLNYIRFQHS